MHVIINVDVKYVTNLSDDIGHTLLTTPPKVARCYYASFETAFAPILPFEALIIKVCSLIFKNLIRWPRQHWCLNFLQQFSIVTRLNHVRLVWLEITLGKPLTYNPVGSSPFLT